MVYTPPEYPGEIPEFAEVWPPVDDINWMYTSAWDALVKELRAIMIELGTDPAGASADVKTRLGLLALKANVLELDNEDAFTPDADYEPATKKYVDDAAGVGDKISEGDSSVEVIDTDGDGHVDIKTENVLCGKFNSDGILDLPKQSRCNVYRNGTQIIPTTATTKVEFNAERYDNQNEFDPITNYRFTATKEGNYLVILRVTFSTVLASSIRVYAIIFKNGADFSTADIGSSASVYQGPGVSAIIHLAANDYIEGFVHQRTGGNADIYGAELYTFMHIHKLS